MKETTNLKKAFPFFKDLKLTPKQILFIHRYANNNFNAVEAYTWAGYESTDPEIIGSSSARLLSVPTVREALRKYLEDVLSSERDELEKKLFDTFFIQAFYDPQMFYNPDGSLAFTTWAEIPEQYRCCVESLETKFYGKDAERRVVVMKLIDRKWAQDKLDKYIGMTKERVEETHIFRMTPEAEKKLNELFGPAITPEQK